MFSIVLFYLLSICPNRGEVLFHMMNRFSLFSPENQSYDSFIVLLKDQPNSKEKKQFQTNLQSFNTQFRNVFLFHCFSYCRFSNSRQILKSAFLSIIKMHILFNQIFIFLLSHLFHLIILFSLVH